MEYQDDNVDLIALSTTNDLQQSDDSGDESQLI